jgi:CO/xanthine dehydrogenase FAD-binding subunit
VVIPTTTAEAVAVLSQQPDALVLAGGTDLMVEINEGRRRVADDQVMVCINRIPELRSWTLDRAAGVIRLGAAVTYAQLAAPPLADIVPALAQAARTVGSPQIRNAATIGGNVVTCSPAGDGLPVLAAVDAEVGLDSVDGERRLPIAEFMRGVKRTALRPGELLTTVTVPLLSGWQGYVKVGVRNAMVIAISGACLAVDEPSRSVRLALGSVAPTIVRAGDAERLIADSVDWDARTVAAEAVGEFGRLAAAASNPIDDHRSTAAYRRHSIRVLAERLLRRAFAVSGEEAISA